MTNPTAVPTKRFEMQVTVHLILIKEGKVLLLRRFQTGYADGQYGLPGGCLEGKERATEAMIREAEEEAGVILKPEWLKTSCVMHHASKGWEGMCLFFTASEWDGTIANCEPDKCDDMRFFPLDELPDNLIPYMKKGIQQSLEGKKAFLEFGW